MTLFPIQEYVESLQDNNWCGHPVINSFDVPYEADENGVAEPPDHYDVGRKSLENIGYSLLGYKRLCEASQNG